MELVAGPLRALEGLWTFTPVGSNGCRIELQLRFEFSNPLKAALLEPLLKESRPRWCRPSSAGRSNQPCLSDAIQALPAGPRCDPQGPILLCARRLPVERHDRRGAVQARAQLQDSGDCGGRLGRVPPTGIFGVRCERDTCRAMAIASSFTARCPTDPRERAAAAQRGGAGRSAAGARPMRAQIGLVS